MPSAQKGGVQPPNLSQFAAPNGDAANGFLPLTRSASTITPTNLSRFMHGDPGGSADMTRLGSPVSPPNAGIFGSGQGDKGMSDANYPATVQPGVGAVPVNPFKVDGGIMPASEMKDTAAK
jgi:hypothetical protein